MNLHRMLVAFATTFACLTASAQTDCTDKITNPNFDAKDFTGWDMQKPATFGSAPSTGVKATSSGNPVVTAYSTTFDCKQTVEGLTPGIYKLSVQAFSRPISDVATIWTAYKAGNLTASDNTFYGNSSEKKVMLICEDYCSELSGGTTMESGKIVPNSSSTTSTAFSQTPIHYDQYLYCEVGQDGKLTLGIKATGCDGSYYGFDNFRLYGPIAAIPAEDVTALVASAPTGKMNATVQNTMDTFIKALQAEASVSNYSAAVKAIEDAKASVTVYSAVKEALDKAEKIQLSDAARAEYNTAVESIVKAYNEGTMTGDGSEQVAAIQKAVDAAKAKDAAASVQADCTDKIVNPNFADGKNGWSGDWGNGDVKATSVNPLITSNNSKFDVYQDIKGLVNGRYRLKVQAFTRPMTHSNLKTAIANGETLNNQTYLYANDTKKLVKLITEETSTDSKCGDEIETGKRIPNSSTQAANAFNAGMYENELEFVVTTGSVRIGISQESDNGTTYVGYDNFRLYLVEEYKIDLTEKLANPSFNDGTNGWTVNKGKIEVKAASTGNPVVTAYGYNVDICQKVTGLEPGKYIVKVQACSRYKDKAAGIADYEAKKAAGEEIPNEAYLYANGVQKKVVNIWDEGADYDFAKESGQAASDLTLSNGKQIPYNSTNFSNAFGKLGMYENELVCEVKEDGELTVGIKNELTGDGYNLYIGYDNFRLYRYQDASAIISDAGYATAAYREDVAVPQGVKAYVVSGIEGQVLTLTEVTAIPAKTGVILEGAAGYYKMTAATSAVAPVEKNLLSPKYIGEKISAGNYVLQSQNSKVGFYKLDQARATEKDCAYLSVPAAAASIKAYYFEADEETAIETIEVLTSGKAKIYDLNGRQLNSLQKGINIVNGKKILVK